MLPFLQLENKMKIHIVESIYYDEGIPCDGRTYCGISGDYSENLEGCFVQKNESRKSTCLKCIKIFNKENGNFI